MKIKTIISAIIILVIASCTKDWENHYDVYPETVNQNVWEVLQNKSEVSEFVEALKDFKYDTLFSSDISYTVFAPTNEAWSNYTATNELDTMLLNYLIAPAFVQSESIKGKRKIQTRGKKFALFEKNGNLTFDGVPLTDESPLYRNGKYYIMEEVAEPKPNLYDYYKVHNPVLKEYIDSQDSIVLDLERSTPTGFNPEGETIYDSVTIVYNKFEEEYFPVSKEFRNATATIVFPRQEDYREALSEMALDLNIPGYTDYSDIPDIWQKNVLVPHLLEQGVFQNMLEPEAFMLKANQDTVKLKNILGDSIPIFYTPVDKVIASNGYSYNYQDFQIPDSLYKRTEKFEAEWLTDESGVNRYSWNERVIVKSDKTFRPLQENIRTASNDTIVRVLFDSGYDGTYTIEFESGYLFPRKFAMVVATHMNIGGIYDIYVNDELVKTVDYANEFQWGFVSSVIPGKRYFPEGGFIKFDVVVDNIVEFSRAKIRFEYKGPGRTRINGFVLDYVGFIPFDEE